MKFLKKINKLLLVAIMSTLCIFLVKTEAPSVNADSTYRGRVQELRAVWVSHFAGDVHAYNDEESYKAEINGILDNMEQMGFNAMIFHVRTHNNALYKSELNPVASFWSKVNFDEFDPLEWMIEECHSRGIEFHAWMNPYRISTNGTTKHYVGGTIPEGNPVLNPDNLLQSGDSYILDPGIPEVRDYIVDSCMEVVENYDVDAIHFDDYFYISGCDDAETRAKYNTENLSLGNFRRKQVDLFIEQLSDKMYEYNVANNKTIQLGISPSGIYRNGSYSAGTTPQYDADGNLTYPLYSSTSGFAHYDNYLYSDTKKWIDEEWIDYILPQTYWAIGHTSASYAKLAEWWSWTVEYKKVNLYLGVGIYMSLENTSSGSYWKGANEVKNQLELANSYANIDGLSFYKYSSMLNSSSLMQGYVKDLETYWIKDIPGSVQQRYTHLPEPDVANIVLDGNTLSWDPVDGVRGYIVWQTKRNDEVNMIDKDINQVYVYTQNTQVQIEDGYDYFVSTVNLANEISEPLSAKQGGNVERVINLINGITIPVTLDNENKINNIQAKYNALTAEEKAQVTNYQILEFAKEQIAKLKLIKNDALDFVETLKTDTTSNYILPQSYLNYSVAWEYVDPSDANLFDIETGEVKVEYLATTLVSLKYTLTNNGMSYSDVFDLNIGYVKQSEIGLIYRNTPNSLNKEEDKDANVSFIGWSGKALKFNNYVFFIAANNYHELTSTEISKGSWSSCGNVYVNMTNQTISKPVSDFSITTISNYGYFIVNANGEVRLSAATATSQDIITLAPGEILYSSNYLDGLINNSPLRPATGVIVGTKVELITPVWQEELTDAEKAQELVELIDTIPLDVTLNHKASVEKMDEIYNTLSDSAKAQVTNYSKLVAALTKITVLEDSLQELNNKKESSVNELNNYITNLDDYSNSGKSQINNILSMAQIEINESSSTTAIDTLVSTYKQQLDAVLTQAEEDVLVIQDERDLALTQLNAVITNLNLYSPINQKLINDTIENYTNLINQSNTVNKVRALLSEGIEKLESFKTIVEELQQAGIDKVNELVENIEYSNYSSTNAGIIRNAVLNTKTKILVSTKEEEINTLVSELEELIASTKTKEEELKELQVEKDAALNIINESYHLEDYNSESQLQLEAIISQYVNLINNATSSSKITVYKIECLSKIKEIPIDELAHQKRLAKEEANEYVDSLITTETGKNLLTTLYNEFVEELANETIPGKITILLNNFKEEAKEIEKANPIESEDPSDPNDKDEPTDDKKDNNGSCQFASTYIVSMLFMSIIAAILIIKKRY